MNSWLVFLPPFWSTFPERFYKLILLEYSYQHCETQNTRSLLKETQNTRSLLKMWWYSAKAVNNRA